MMIIGEKGAAEIKGHLNFERRQTQAGLTEPD